MRDFGVLEQEVLIADFAAACREAGFRDIRINTLVYAIPGFELTPEQWQSWTRRVSSKRPVRALRKIALAFAEIFGIGKRSFLFEEAFSMSVLRALRHASEDHPIIVASKMGPGRPEMPLRRSARIEIAMPDRIPKATSFPVRARLNNRGSTAWQAVSRSGIGHVTLGVQLLDDGGRLLTRDYHRVPLPRDVAAGSSLDVSFNCPAPDASGSYKLKFDLVAEGVTWFEVAGSPTVTSRLTVV